MRHRRILTVAGAVLLAALAAYGGEPSRDGLREKLIGRWRPAGQLPGDDALGDPESMLETYRADGTGTATGFKTHWSLKGDVVSLAFPDKSVTQFRISIRGDELTETDLKTGRVVRLKRLKPGEEA